MIATLAAGRDLTRTEMIDILLAAGYRVSSAAGRLSSCHPLFRRAGPDGTDWSATPNRAGQSVRSVGRSARASPARRYASAMYSSSLILSIRHWFRPPIWMPFRSPLRSRA